MLRQPRYAGEPGSATAVRDGSADGSRTGCGHRHRCLWEGRTKGARLSLRPFGASVCGPRPESVGGRVQAGQKIGELEEAGTSEDLFQVGFVPPDDLLEPRTAGPAARCE